MKVIIVYYSLEGNCKYVADQISEKTSADILRIESVKNYPNKGFGKFFFGGKDAMTGKNPELKPYSFDASKYDMVIIGTPVWAGTFAPPIKKFLADNSLTGKKVALFACSMSGYAEGCLKKLKNILVGSEIIAEVNLIEPGSKKTEETDNKINEFCNRIS